VALAGVKKLIFFLEKLAFAQKNHKKPSALARRRLQRAITEPASNRQSLIIATNGATCVSSFHTKRSL
jgi:hypothetical protein